MKKRILALGLAMLMLVGCSNPGKKSDDASKGKSTGTKQEIQKDSKDKKTITVTTSFINDMVHQLVGDKANIQMIIPAGEDPHLYVAKPEDHKKLTEADLVLYHGLHFEGKMVEALERTGYAITSTFDKAKVGQMEGDNGKMEQDPHFWFNLELYNEAFTNVANKLKEFYKDNAELVKEIDSKAKAYSQKLTELDKYIKDRVKEIPDGSRYLITPHDAFNYFAKSYGVEVMAPQGISTDSEVANKEIESTAQFVVDKKVKAIFAESTTDPARMKKLQEVVKSKGFDVKVVSGEGNELFSDSLAPKGQKGDTFIDMYKHNIDLIVNNLK